MIDIDRLRLWIGKSETLSDTIDLATCQRMEATLDQPASLKDGDPLPPLWHWCWFHQPVRTGELGRDGHPEKGGFLPPVTLPRRMWAGGRFRFENNLPIGASATKTSTIKSVKAKQGRSGELCFVTVEHEIKLNGQTCLVEEHDIVYREDPKPGDKPASSSTTPKRQNPDFCRTITPSPTMLFRYSALTFNGHRIHYDRDYCRDVEGYPGLVFHGPLTATLLAGLAVENNTGQQLKRFEFRATNPVFDIDAFVISGKQQEPTCWLKAEQEKNRTAMSALAQFCKPGLKNS